MFHSSTNSSACDVTHVPGSPSPSLLVHIEMIGDRWNEAKARQRDQGHGKWPSSQVSYYGLGWKYGSNKLHISIIGHVARYHQKWKDLRKELLCARAKFSLSGGHTPSPTHPLHMYLCIASYTSLVCWLLDSCIPSLNIIPLLPVTNAYKHTYM